MTDYLACLVFPYYYNTISHLTLLYCMYLLSLYEVCMP